MTSPAQRILARVLPRAWVADLEAETRLWEVACKTCGRSKDLWEAGGLRWKAKGTKTVQGFCMGCDARRTMEIRPRGRSPGA